MEIRQSSFSRYEDTVNYLNSSSMFSIKLGLERIQSFLSTIDNPQDTIPAIHIAGTNGKGSVLKYIENILIEAGFKIGSYTSPHLVDYTERFCINKVPISRNDFLKMSNKLFDQLERKNHSHLTQFEFLTVLAFMYFNDHNTDINLIETGMGGQFDATNVIKNPLVNVITHIDYDHTEYLGDTLEKIGAEKAGIIKPGSDVVINTNNNATNTIIRISMKKEAFINLANPCEYDLKIDTDNKIQSIIDRKKNIQYTTTLLGAHQLDNISLVLKVVDILNNKGYKITSEQIINGIKNTKWAGRCEYIEEENILLDGAHNPNGAMALRKIIDTYFPQKPIKWIIGTLKTKDSANILNNLINPDDIVILTEVKASNTSKTSVLADLITTNNLTKNIITTSTLKEAYNHSLKMNHDNSLTVITGSLYLVGEFYKIKA